GSQGGHEQRLLRRLVRRNRSFSSSVWPYSCMRNKTRRFENMAAVTADTLTLPRVTRAGLGDVERPVLAVSTAPSCFGGEGFPVRRTMAGNACQYPAL